MADARSPTDKQQDDAEFAARRRKRSIALALALGALVLIFYVLTIVKIGPACSIGRSEMTDAAPFPNDEARQSQPRVGAIVLGGGGRGHGRRRLRGRAALRDVLQAHRL